MHLDRSFLRVLCLATLSHIGLAWALPPETDIPYQGSSELHLGTLVFHLDRQSIFAPDGQLLVEHLYTAPVVNPSALCAADDNTDGLGRLRCWDSQGSATLLATGGRPGRLAIQSNGPMVAWVASPEGIPQVFVASTDGKIPPKALTNVGLQRILGQAPVGFVAPPLRQSLHFDGDLLRWDAPEGPLSVRWH